MKYIQNQKQLFSLTPLSMAFATVFSFSQINTAIAETVPPGFYLMPDGRIMAENPETAEAPKGYHLRPNGILLRIDFDDEETSTMKPAGTAPPGYHMMADGTLMSNSGGGSHHGAGMWMADYKYIHMDMKDLLDTNNRLTAEQAIDPDGIYKYTMSPTDMSMDMHMGMLMYGFTNRFMGMLMVHYMNNNMGMLSSDGTKSTMKTSGMADTAISGMFKGPYNLNFMLGIGLPTGSIDERGPMTHTASVTEQDVKYPYGMQLGSGSYELKQGIEYSDAFHSISWGSNYEITVRLNDNKHNYKLGNLLELEGWTQWDMHSLLSMKANVKLHSQGQISGADEEITDILFKMSPSYNAENYGGNRVDLGGSAKLKIPGNIYSITTEFSMPIYQNLWGPQMATNWIASINFGAMW